MSIIKKYILFIVLILGSLASKPQTLRQTLAMADSMFATGKYEQATLFYRRVLFFSADKSSIYLPLADSYFQEKQYKSAYSYYTLAYSVSADSCQKQEICFKKVLCNLLLRNYALGLQDILQLPDSLPDLQNRKRNFYIASLYFGLKNYLQAEAYFVASVPDTALQAKTEINELLHCKAIEVRRVKLAYYLSLLVPGSGQLMAHEYEKAANSFVLTGGLLLLTYYMTQVYSPADAFFAAFPWLYRYYIGGAIHAENMVKNRQDRQIGIIYQQIVEIYDSF